MSTEEREHLADISVYRDKDGYAASWEAGGTWDHATIADALDVVANALDEEPAEGGGSQ